MSTANTNNTAATAGCAPSAGSQLVTVADALKWAMELCREAAQNAETLTRYYAKGRKYKKLADEARQQASNAKVAIAHLERVLAENA
jgi:hypothetical protein